MPDHIDEISIEKYECRLSTSKDNRTCKLSPETGKGMDPKGRKIYIVCDGTRFLYVGETATSIKTKFQRGCTAFNHYQRTKKARGGYRGYKWLDPKENPAESLTIHVIIFNDPSTARDFVESVESELAFLVRLNNKNWPKFQNEIHFHNTSGSQELAAYIYEQIGRK